MATFPMLMPKYDAEEALPLPSTDYLRSVIQWTGAAYEEALYVQQQSVELSEVQGFIDYLEGRQWSMPRPQYKSKPVNNRMVRLFWELVGQLTDLRLTFEVRSSWMGESPSVKRDTEVLTHGLRAWAFETDYDMALAKCIAYAVLTTSFAKYQWNPSLNFRQGELQILPLAPDAVLPLKATDDLDSAEVVIFKDVMTLRWFREHFPRMGSLVRADDRYSSFQTQPIPPSNLSPAIFKAMSPGLRMQLAGKPVTHQSAMPMAEYREYWIKDETKNTFNKNVVVGDSDKNWSYIVKPGEMLYPRGRLIITGGNVPVWDGPNPYWHGRPPFAMLRLNVMPWKFYGASDLKSQVPLQDIINNILAGVLDLVKKAVNPPWYAPKNALSSEVWNNFDFSMPNARMAYNPQTVQPPKFAPTPPIPGVLLPLIQLIEREMDQSSTGALAGELAKKKQLPAMEGIEALKETKNTPIRLKGRNIETFLKTGGQMMVSNMIQFWPAKRRLQRLGPNGLTFEDFDWDRGTMVPDSENAEEFARRFKFFIQPGSLLSIKRMEDKMEALGLFKVHALSMKGLYRVLGREGEYETVKNEMIEEAKLMQAFAPKKGAGKVAAHA